ncbi:MAG: restriction endonuclease [Halobacteriales archaeon]|nr:restriction endonuclease [Halobacteriales archaeon]
MTNHPEDISTIPPTDFEEFIAELWSELGWEATTTRSAGDDGVDVIAQRNEPYEQRKLIQVKQREDRLDRRSVQQYSYLHHKDNVDEVLLIGTSGFTKGATQSAQVANVKLIGPDEIMSLVEKADAGHLLERYVGSDTLSSDDSPESAVDKSETQDYSYETDEFEEVSSSGQVYAELANSIPCSDMCSPKARLSIALQFFRGDSPLHVLLVEQTGEVTTTILNEIAELCDDSAYVNCQTTTEGGLVGRYNSSGRTHTGVFTRYEGIVALDEIDELPSPEICKEPLTQQQITVSKAGSHRSYPTQFSCLATMKPEYGRLDEYEGLETQIDSSVITYFDCVCITSKEDSGKVDLPSGYLDIEDGTGLSEEELVEYSMYANNEYSDPELNAGAEEKLEEILSNWDSYEAGLPVSNSTRSSFVTVAKASARMRLSNEVQEVDTKIASNILAQGLGSIGSETGEFDIDVIESGTGSKEEINDIEDVIRTISENREDGKAPLSEIIEMGNDYGMSEEKINEEINTLRRRGELIEPHEDEFMLI